MTIQNTKATTVWVSLLLWRASTGLGVEEDETIAWVRGGYSATVRHGLAPTLLAGLYVARSPTWYSRPLSNRAGGATCNPNNPSVWNAARCGERAVSCRRGRLHEFVTAAEWLESSCEYVRTQHVGDAGDPDLPFGDGLRSLQQIERGSRGWPPWQREGWQLRDWRRCDPPAERSRSHSPALAQILGGCCRAPAWAKSRLRQVPRCGNP